MKRPRARSLRVQDPRLAKVHAASLSDAMRKLHPHRHHVLDLVTPTPGRVLFGPAATMLFAPLRADQPNDFNGALDRIAKPGTARSRSEGEAVPQHGTILVCAAPGAEDAAVVGGVRLARVASLGFAGVITTARVRDFAEIRDLAVYCRGETPLAGSSEAMPVATNVPIALDGATVVPGDFVYADAAGAIVIPAKDVDKVLAMAAEIEAADAERVKAMQGSSRSS